jgi:hypothetical protein
MTFLIELMHIEISLHNRFLEMYYLELFFDLNEQNTTIHVYSSSIKINGYP